MERQVNIHEAKTHLSRLIEQVQLGDEIIIAKAGRPVAKLTAIRPDFRRRAPGSAVGSLRVTDDFDAPLPQDMVGDFES